MSVRNHTKIIAVMLSGEYRPVLRYSLGATILMTFAVAFGGQLAYTVPFLSLNFLSPGTKMPSFKQGFNFVITVALTTFAGFLFTRFLFNYALLFAVLLGLVLFWLYYTVRVPLMTKLFLLISILSMPVPKPGYDQSVWSFAIMTTLTSGALVSIFVVWLVFSLFPDKQTSNNTATPKQPVKKQIFDSKKQMRKAIEVFLITFPAVLGFIFFQGGNALLVLIYIVVLAMVSDVDKVAGMGKIYGNIVALIPVVVFYQLIVTAPFLPFFILLFLGTSLWFASRIFSDSPVAGIYKTGYSSLVLIIGQAALGGDAAAGEIWTRIIQVLIAVIYVVAAYKIVGFIRYKKDNITNKQKLIGSYS